MYFFNVCLLIYFVSYAKSQYQEKNESTTYDGAQDQDEVTTYDGAQVWRVNIRNEQDINTIFKLVEDRDVSLWNLESTRADFLVQMKDKVIVNRVLNAQDLHHSVLIMDVQRRMDSLATEPATWSEDTLRIGHRLNWKEYPTLKVINEYYDYLTENFPSICYVTTIGHTYEKRPIKMVKITNGNKNNKVILITAGIHAREWVAITSTLYVLDKVISKFDDLPIYMKTIDWMFVPVLNPDGYEYSHTHDRLWRKNRRKISACRGIDINRNFDIDWDVAGIRDTKECYETYGGPKAFSEAESDALRNLILDSKETPLAMLDIHSYGNLIMYPWSARPTPTKDRKLLRNSAKTMSESIYNITGKTFKYGSTYHMIYPATGVAMDWMYHSGVTLSYAIELGDDGANGFLVPPENIVSVGKELLVGVKDLLKNIHPRLTKKGGHNDSKWF